MLTLQGWCTTASSLCPHANPSRHESLHYWRMNIPLNIQQRGLCTHQEISAHRPRLHNAQGHHTKIIPCAWRSHPMHEAHTMTPPHEHTNSIPTGHSTTLRPMHENWTPPHDVMAIAPPCKYILFRDYTVHLLCIYSSWCPLYSTPTHVSTPAHSLSGCVVGYSYVCHHTD